MTSGTCGSSRKASHWNCDQGLNNDSTVKTHVPLRRKREFTPNELKDDNYWMKRSRNNEAAKRSRERRRTEERLLEERALQLLRENEKLRETLSAINYHFVGKETPCDNLHYSRFRELPRDSRSCSQLSYAGATTIPHYDHADRCDFNSAHNSVPLQRTQNFHSALSHTRQRDGYVGISHTHHKEASLGIHHTHHGDGHIGIHQTHQGNGYLGNHHTHQRGGYPGIHAPSDVNVFFRAYSNEAHTITKRNLDQGHVDPAIIPVSAPFFLKEIVPEYQCPTRSTSKFVSHERRTETNQEKRSLMTDPTEAGKEIKIGKDADRVQTSPLLPHKLRYKVNKLRVGGASALSSSAITHYIQE